MKILKDGWEDFAERATLVAFALFMAACYVMAASGDFAKAQTQEQQQKNVGYVGGACWDNIFTVEHIVIGRGTLTIDYFMPAADQVQKEDNPYIFEYKVEPEEEINKGLIKFGGNLYTVGHEAEIKDHKVSIHGLINPANKRYAAIVVVDGEPGHFMWGAEGTTDDMIKLSEDYHKQCGTIHQLPQGLIPTYLRNWVDGKL